MESLLKARNAERRLFVFSTAWTMQRGTRRRSTPGATFDVESLDTRARNKAALQHEVGLPVRDDVPLLGFVSRLVEQKGVDILSAVLDRLFSRDVQFVLLATGEKRYEDLFSRCQALPHKAAVLLNSMWHWRRKSMAGGYVPDAEPL